jgi:hypothetical protein
MVLSDFWVLLSVDQRAIVAKELVTSEGQLKRQSCGTFIWNKCQLMEFKTNEQRWRRLQTETEAKRKSFEGIFEGKRKFRSTLELHINI